MSKEKRKHDNLNADVVLVFTSEHELVGTFSKDENLKIVALQTFIDEFGETRYKSHGEADVIPMSYLSTRAAKAVRDNIQEENEI